MGNSPYNGFLTGADRDLLEELSGGADLGKKKDERYATRQRAARALRDFVLLERQLPDGNDRRLIFNTLMDPELWESEPDHSKVMRDLFAFLFRAYIPNYGIDFAETQQWMERGIRKAINPAYVFVYVETVDEKLLDKWRSEFREDEETFMEETSDRHPVPGLPLQALLQSGRIRPEEYLRNAEGGESIGGGFSDSEE